MSDGHQTYTGFATGIGHMAGFFLVFVAGAIVLSGIIDLVRYLFTL